MRRILLDRGADDIGNAAVVTEVHDLGAVRLQQAADDVIAASWPSKSDARSRSAAVPRPLAIPGDAAPRCCPHFLAHAPNPCDDSRRCRPVYSYY